MSTIENPKFRLKAIAELLDGDHHFYIPSYQRGYRWDKKQVEDLLKDIWDFAKNDEKKKDEFYCLQPIVVKEKDKKWIVIDGQQRLTTLLLMLNFIKDGSRTPFVINSNIYEIDYHTRTSMDFIKPIKDSDIDSFHVFQAKYVIEKWFEDRIDEVDYAALEKVLFNKSLDIPQVKVIWYVTDNDSEIESIKVFNNLNKGKIKLTNAELIKALFILKTREVKDDKKIEQLNINEFAYEWNEIENKLQDNRFWYFLTNIDYNPATRIDLIFDFLTEKKMNQDDDDFAYRKFQNLYDSTKDELWEEKDVKNFTNAWKKVKEVFQTFIYWYEDGEIYHYIGFLVYYGVSLRSIYKVCKNENKSNTVAILQNLITKKVLNFSKDDIDNLTHSENPKDCQKVLLFFNIETCVKQLQNQNKKVKNDESYSYYKFPFDLLKINNWDVEHVGSKTENPIREPKDKIIWLSYVPHLNNNHSDWENIVRDSKVLLEDLKISNKDEGNRFPAVYQRIVTLIQKNENDNKDTLDNLALLDSGTNRGYGNALFPSKRQIIIEKDINGVFIPICTKNLFLKYYSTDDTEASQWKNSWEDTDRKAYLGTIHKTIDFILN